MSIKSSRRGIHHWYSEYRNSFDHPDPHLKYKRPLIYWHIFAVRLAFIVVYQNLVSFVMTAVQWIIPDMSRKLNDRIRKEAYKTNETIIHHETERARRKKSRQDTRHYHSLRSTYHTISCINKLQTHRPRTNNEETINPK
ncbi:anoctamin-4-like [Leptinotarsa decemlineata]|uniref:anoctamin-4-like n=1 Tax=Leptinotarsa decemlineata TaxID=7539 RepID=UPI003D3065C9